jgi:dienelactone hydrolase
MTAILVLLLAGCCFGPETTIDAGAETSVSPDPLVFNSGEAVRDPSAWPARRAEMRTLVIEGEYGAMPPPPGVVRAEPIDAQLRFDNSAKAEHFALSWPEAPGFRMECGLIVPTTPGPHPVIVAVDPVWQPHVEPTARQVLARGYALAGLKYHDVDPDKGERNAGIYPHYPEYRWGSIAAWAWAASRLIDYLVTRPEIDATHIVITGHSRCGKAAILAGALDERIALVAPHCSGAGGAALYRVHNRGSETLALITQPDRFHYWFVARLREYADREDRLPFDQHFLHALIAPRAFLSLEGQDDRWANPRGAWAACVAAIPVYRMHGAEDRLAYHIRPGGHDMTAGDWQTLLDFADTIFLGKALPAAGVLRGSALSDEPPGLPQ